MWITQKALWITFVLLIAGCGTASYTIRSCDTPGGGQEITLTATGGRFLGIFPAGNKVPPGTYSGKIGDREIAVDTKPDLRLLEINANKTDLK